MLHREDILLLENTKLKAPLEDASMFGETVQQIEHIFKQFDLAGASKSV